MSSCRTSLSQQNKSKDYQKGTRDCLKEGNLLLYCWGTVRFLQAHTVVLCRCGLGLPWGALHASTAPCALGQPTWQSPLTPELLQSAQVQQNSLIDTFPPPSEAKWSSNYWTGGTYKFLADVPGDQLSFLLLGECIHLWEADADAVSLHTMTQFIVFLILVRQGCQWVGREKLVVVCSTCLSYALLTLLVLSFRGAVFCQALWYYVVRWNLRRLTKCDSTLQGRDWFSGRSFPRRVWLPQSFRRWDWEVFCAEIVKFSSTFGCLGQISVLTVRQTGASYRYPVIFFYCISQPTYLTWRGPSAPNKIQV